MTNPNVRLATKTLAAIEAAIEADQGAAYRGWLRRILPHMSDAYREEEDGFRSHLGASVIGKECPRAVYYSWRWFTRPRFIGRMIRLFNRGHIEEARIIAALQLIGIQVYQQDAEGNQFRIHHAGGHVGGAGDGVGVGIPDLPEGQAALLEFKTYNDKQFAKLKQDGVREAKPQHYTQMQILMEKMGIPVALYIAVNKNDDEFYAEIIVLNRYHAGEYLNFGESIVFAKKAPERISNTPGFWKCRFCDERPHCHKLGGTIEINCRTCIKSEALPDGNWLCNMHNITLTKEQQLKGCGDHIPL
jgi:hypothetical protein